jgi:pSer/pThr/pTyr-binding forkhead associated (FHA) protein
VKSFLLSWLARKHAGATLQTFVQEHPGAWIVWEAGPWRPPAARRETMAAGPGTRLLAAGESLVIALAAKDGGADVRLGRGPENDLVVDDATLSRAHLHFHRDPAGVWTVRDAGSSNGTLLDGAPLGTSPLPIAPGGRLEAGAVRLTFLDGAALYLRLRGVS